MMRCLRLFTLVVPLSMPVFLIAPVPAGAGDYDLERNTVDGGGTTGSTGGSYKIGGSIGQPDAATLSAGGYRLSGGFLGGVVHAVTPTLTGVVSPTPSRTTDTTESPTPIVTSTATIPSTPTATGGPPKCPGDCDGGGVVTVDELILAVNIALGTTPVGDCPAADRSGDDSVTVDELIGAVNNALEGCPAQVALSAVPQVRPAME